MSEELTLVVVVGEMDESIVDDINGIAASVKHKIISIITMLNASMHILVLERAGVLMTEVGTGVLMTGVGVMVTVVGVTPGGSVTMS